MIYAAIGAASNATLYCVYLLLTALGMGHKTAMSLSFGLGVLLTFVFNRRWTFRHRGAVSRSAIRYGWAYVLAYLGNIVTLLVFVDLFHFPHRLVVLVSIVATACMMFVLQKYWVFSDGDGEAAD